MDIFTGKGKVTRKLTVTFNMSMFWAVFISPGIFKHDFTGIDFTEIN
jgi:hypothetical protein